MSLSLSDDGGCAWFFHRKLGDYQWFYGFFHDNREDTGRSFVFFLVEIMTDCYIWLKWLFW